MFDSDAYFDAVVAGDLRRDVVGPARLHWAAWDQLRRDLLDAHPAGSGAESAAIRLACRQGFVLTHQQTRVCGMNRARVRQLVRGGSWTIPRRGVLCVAPRTEQPTRADEDRIEVRAAAAALVRPGMFVSHDCATATHGLPLLTPPGRIALTATWRPAACAWPDVVIRVAALAKADVASWFGAGVTAVARTVVDDARHSIRAGLVAADAALREGLLDEAELNAAIERQRGWPGVQAARLVAELASPLSESPLESLARLFLYDRGVVLPMQQAWVDTPGGRYRVDGLWPDRGVILEVDGMDKYRRRPESITAEKRRQEALERAGYRVVRVTWEDIHRFPDVTMARIRRALRLGGDLIRR